MRLIIGLGNPGEKYKNTRHNVGFMVADALQKIKLQNSVVVKKSNTFMNQSGESVGKMVNKYMIDLSNLYVVHDDLDILLGSYKIQFGKGPKDHNGIKSVDNVLGTDQYWHIRVGIDNRSSDNRQTGEEYVLQDFTEDEMVILDKVISEVCRKIIKTV